jgi:hypothetical protein
MRITTGKLAEIIRVDIQESSFQLLEMPCAPNPPPNSNESNSSPGFLQLPIEVTEGILSEIDIHRDLIALALTSRSFTHLIIPHHSEYRVIRIRHALPSTWVYLARRADLTRNIREVHLCARDDCTAPDRYPTVLDDTMANVDWIPSQNRELYAQDFEANRLGNICRALGHMKRLRVFTWAYLWSNHRWPGGISPIFEERVLGVISKTPSVRHVALFGQFGKHVRDGRGLGGACYPVRTSCSCLTH